MRLAIIVLFSILVSACVSMGSPEAGKPLSVTDQNTNIIFSVTTHESIMLNKRGKTTEECIGVSDFWVGSCLPHVTSLGVAVFDESLGGLAGKHFFDIRENIHILETSDSLGNLIAFQFFQPTDRTSTQIVSEKIASKVPATGKVYYLGHINIDKNWKITVTDRRKEDVERLAMSYPDIRNYDIEGLKHKIIPLDYTESEMFDLVGREL